MCTLLPTESELSLQDLDAVVSLWITQNAFGKDHISQEVIHVHLNLRGANVLHWIQLRRSQPETSRETFETTPEGMNHSEGAEVLSFNIVEYCKVLYSQPDSIFK